MAERPGEISERRKFLQAGEKHGRIGRLQAITLKVIGKVKNSVRRMKREGWESVVSEIILHSKYEEALAGVEDYSHLLILFWMSRLHRTDREMKQIHPKSRRDLPLVGIFATRTQYRPNPIGLTLVKLVGRKKNILRVRGLDAVNGTPVIDIKPLSPRHENPANVRVPGWYYLLWPRKGAAG
jgi:tRNA-Thr(GGU) m(6)t(6)A37 methyltransferase TsaA